MLLIAVPRRGHSERCVCTLWPVDKLSLLNVEKIFEGQTGQGNFSSQRGCVTDNPGGEGVMEEVVVRVTKGTGILGGRERPTVAIERT